MTHWHIYTTLYYFTDVNGNPQKAAVAQPCHHYLKYVYKVQGHRGSCNSPEAEEVKQCQMFDSYLPNIKGKNTKIKECKDSEERLSHKSV